MTAPKRIQLRRTKGWRKPEGAIVVSRPSKWGNPWRIVPVDRYGHYPFGWRVIGDPTVAAHGFLWPSEQQAAARAVKLYRDWMLSSAARCADLVPLLAGHDLACWCPLADANGNRMPCHADILLEVANS